MIKISYIEQVQQYKYLGSIINDSNTIADEVKERIALGVYKGILREPKVL